MKLVVRTLSDLQKQPDDLRKLDPRGGGSGISRMGSSSSSGKKGCCVVM